jgi:crotonobetainyl-CoA:carnitine CoA-transferase CaiB-like acyl-CoA transferase
VTDEEFRAMCVAYERLDVADDPALTTLADRLTDPTRYRKAREKLHEAASTFTTAEAVQRLNDGGVPAVPLVPVADVPHHAQVVANRTFVRSEHPVAGPLIEPRPPVRFGGTSLEPSGPAPTMGQHTDDILSELGYDLASIAELRERRIVE